MRPITQADWLLLQSQQHFQKLAHLSVRAVGAQQMGKVAAQRQFALQRPTSSVGRVYYSDEMEKVALRGLFQAGKSVVGRLTQSLKGGTTAATKALKAPKVPSVSGAPKMPSAGRPSVTPAAGGAPGGAPRAAAPTAPTAQAKSPVGRVDPNAQTAFGRTGAQPTPAARPSQAATQDPFAPIPTGRPTAPSPFDPLPADVAQNLNRISGVPGRVTPTPAASAHTGRASIPSVDDLVAANVKSRGAAQAASPVGRVTPPPAAAPPAASPVGQVAGPPTGATATGRVAQIPPAPAPAPVGRVAPPAGGPFRTPGGTPPAPVPPAAPMTPPGALAKPPPTPGGAARPNVPQQEGLDALARLEEMSKAPAVAAPKAAPRTAAAPKGPQTPAQAYDDVQSAMQEGTERAARRADLEARTIDLGGKGKLPDIPEAGVAPAAAQPSAAGVVADQAGGAAADKAQGAVGRWWAGVPMSAKLLGGAGLVGTGLAVGGLGMGAGQALQQSAAPYRYGAGSPFPGQMSYQM